MEQILANGKNADLQLRVFDDSVGKVKAVADHLAAKTIEGLLCSLELLVFWGGIVRYVIVWRNTRTNIDCNSIAGVLLCQFNDIR